MLCQYHSVFKCEYRYGFNGMEKDDEVKGNGNSYDFGARMYDNRLGRWLSLDPMAAKQPAWSPYKMAKDNPILFQDPDGNTEYITITKHNEQTGKTTIINIENDHAVISKGVKTFWLDLQVTQFVDFKTEVNIVIDKNGKETITRSQKIFTSQESQDNDFVWHDGDAKGTKKYSLGHSKHSKEDYKVTGGMVLTSKDGEGTPFNTEGSTESMNIDDLVDVLDGVDIFSVLGIDVKNNASSHYVDKEDVKVGDTTHVEQSDRGGNKHFRTEVKTSDSTHETLLDGFTKERKYDIQR